MESGRKARKLSVKKGSLLPQMKLWLLLGMTAISFLVRLFSVLRYEPTIHEFDPFFQYRATEYMVQHGFKAFLQWFDDIVWYPFGRMISPTTYPGLMIVITFLKRLLDLIGLRVDTKTLCVYTGPAFSIVTTLSSYKLGQMAMDDVGGLVAAFFTSVNSGYLQRSVAGAYDNESICIALLLLFSVLFLKKSRIAPAVYLMLALSWGGFIFVTNLVPLYQLVLIVLNMCDINDIIYFISFSFSALVLETAVPMVGIKGLFGADHVLMVGTLVLCIILLLLRNNKRFNSIDWRGKGMILGAGGVGVVLFGLLLEKLGIVAGWVGRFATLLNPTTKTRSQIVASVAEHQPSTFGLMLFTLDCVLVFLVPGVYQLVRGNKVTKVGVFLVIFLATNLYFVASMVRVIVVLSPIACVVAGVGVAMILKIAVVKGLRLEVDGKLPAEEEEEKENKKGECSDDDDENGKDGTKNSQEKEGRKDRSFFKRCLEALNTPSRSRYVSAQCVTSFAWVAVIFIILLKYFNASLYTAEFIFSNPTIILGAQKKAVAEQRGTTFTKDGILEINYTDQNLLIVDDYREAYSYLKENAKGARIVSWWDYGYQLTEMSELVTFNDNNTIDEKQIAKIGEILVSDERKAHRMMEEIKADYIMVSYGGNVGISGDDVNKMIWILRIVQEELGTVRSADYFNKNGAYLVTSNGAKALHESMIYKLSYYNIDELTGGRNFDLTRKVTVDTPPVKLNYFEEVFSSNNLLVRVYRPRKLVEW